MPGLFCALMLVPKSKAVIYPLSHDVSVLTGDRHMGNIRLIYSKENSQDWILQANVGKNVNLSSDMETNGHDNL